MQTAGQLWKSGSLDSPKQGFRRSEMFFEQTLKHHSPELTAILVESHSYLDQIGGMVFQAVDHPPCDGSASVGESGCVGEPRSSWFLHQPSQHRLAISDESPKCTTNSCLPKGNGFGPGLARYSSLGPREAGPVEKQKGRSQL